MESYNYNNVIFILNNFIIMNLIANRSHNFKQITYSENELMHWVIIIASR